MSFLKLNILFFASRVETIASINGLKDVIGVKKCYSGEFGTLTIINTMITVNLERPLKQVKSKQRLYRSNTV